VFVDCSLICQYAYYSRRTPPTPYRRARSVSYTARVAPEERHSHYRTISTVAANVAATAALAAQREAASPRLQRARWPAPSTDELHEGMRRSSSELTDSEEIEEEALARLADSFHSEGGHASKKHVSWSKERAGSVGPSRRNTLTSLRQVRPNQHASQSEDEQFDQRGRSLERSSSDQGWRRSRDGSSQVGHDSTSRASKRGSSIVFLSVWALFGVGTLVGSKRGIPGNSLMFGRVLSSAVDSAPFIPYESKHIASIENVTSEYPSIISTDISSPVDPKPPPPYENPSWERIIGRISAWACTTLYLTSRLPQIWKNVRHC
jgi:solute carrier family 66 (lysosomal lysine-arginine transporter), member 1